jgi:hypothetical protein
MHHNRRTTIGILGGLVALALPRKAAAQKAVNDILLASKSRKLKLDAFELADGTLLMVENGRPFRMKLAPAPDGQYDLSRSGTIVVENGRAATVLGDVSPVMGPTGIA